MWVLLTCITKAFFIVLVENKRVNFSQKFDLTLTEHSHSDFCLSCVLGMAVSSGKLALICYNRSNIITRQEIIHL